MFAPPPPQNLAAFGSDLPRSATPSPPTISASGGPGGAPATPGTAAAGISSTSVPPSVLAASGVAATGTGAAMVSSETQDRHLDDAVRLAYELLHASRMYPGLHWCVGIFKIATGTETVIVSNDGASYIPPRVYVPRSARVLFADPELDRQLPGQVVRLGQPDRDNGRLRRRAFRSGPQHRAVRGGRDNRPRRLVRASRPTRRRAALSRLRLHALAVRADRARSGTRRDLGYTASPSSRQPPMATSPTPICLRPSVARPLGTRPQVPSQQPSPVPNHFASKLHPSSAKSSAPSPAARPSQTNSGTRSPKCGYSASHCSCGPGSSRSSHPSIRTPPRCTERITTWTAQSKH